MEFKDYLRLLRAHWVGFLLLALLGGLVATGWSLGQPKVYAANATGFITAGKSSDPSMQNVNDVLAKSRVKSYVALATDRSTAEKAIDDLGLDTTPESLIGAISVEQPDDTVLIRITARASSPAGAQRLADAWVAALGERVAEVEGSSETKGMHVEASAQAALPSTPVSPRTGLNIVIGLLAGALLGVAYAVVRSQLDKKLRRSEDVERGFGLSVLGTIPQDSALKHDKSELTPIMVSAEHDAGGTPTAEAFRKLRTNLAFMDVDHPPRVIVMTSPQQSDGKSTLAVNLAATIAAAGRHVTLIDCDLRRPTVAQAFGLVEGVGVTDVLVGRLTAEEALQVHQEFPSLRVMAAGSRPPNPSELLGSQAMRTLLQALAEDGIVIVDAPPLLPVTDAALLTRATDGALVTISTGHTDQDELASAIANIEKVNGKVLGVIMNRVSRRSAKGHYAGYYYTEYTTRPQNRSRGRRRRTKV